MKNALAWGRGHFKTLAVITGCLLLVSGLMFYRLDSLTLGISSKELSYANNFSGLSNIFNNPYNLITQLIDFIVCGATGNSPVLSLRATNAIIGALSIFSFGWLIWLWHGSRTSLLTTVLFATSAWVLHVSRIATADAIYLLAIPMLLITQVLLHRHGNKTYVWYGILITWSLLLYIPGMVWLVILQILFQRKLLFKAWQNFTSTRRRALSGITVTVAGLLLFVGLIKSGRYWYWLGLPDGLAGPVQLLKQLASVPLHIFIHGPQYPELWLGKAPLLDAFTLVSCIIGIYFYVRHWRASRSQTFGCIALVCAILVALEGPVSFTVMLPLIYIAVATGVAYLLHDWLKVFPNNPIARSSGIALICICVAASCTYNIRAYFIAWPNNSVTRQTFQNHH